MPGPFIAEGASVKALDHGKWFIVCRVDKKRFSPEGSEAIAKQIAEALNRT